MRIRFRQTGGFAGLSKSAEVDSTAIGAEEAGRLKSLLSQSRFFELTEPGGTPKPDEEQYYLTVEAAGRSRSITLPRSQIPEDLKPLIKYLAQLAKYEKNR